MARRCGSIVLISITKYSPSSINQETYAKNSGNSALMFPYGRELL